MTYDKKLGMAVHKELRCPLDLISDWYMPFSKFHPSVYILIIVVGTSVIHGVLCTTSVQNGFVQPINMLQLGETAEVVFETLLVVYALFCNNFTKYNSYKWNVVDNMRGFGSRFYPLQTLQNIIWYPYTWKSFLCWCECVSALQQWNLQHQSTKPYNLSSRSSRHSRKTEFSFHLRH